MKEESKLFAASSIQNNGSEYPLVHRRFRLHSMPLKISSWALLLSALTELTRAAAIQCQLWIFTPLLCTCWLENGFADFDI